MPAKRSEGDAPAAKAQPAVRRCFIATPIGEVGTPTRQRADQMFKYILEPAAQACGYEALRADQMPQPGLITTQILDHIINDELVIADLTDHNPNVFYELALRHAINKPVVQVIHRGMPIPFDLAAARTIQVDIHDLDSVATATQQIIDQIRAIQGGEGTFATPITETVELITLRRSDRPEERGLANIFDVLGQIRVCIADIEERLRHVEAALPKPEQQNPPKAA